MKELKILKKNSNLKKPEWNQILQVQQIIQKKRKNCKAKKIRKIHQKHLIKCLIEQPIKILLK